MQAPPRPAGVSRVQTNAPIAARPGRDLVATRTDARRDPVHGASLARLRRSLAGGPRASATAGCRRLIVIAGLLVLVAAACSGPAAGDQCPWGFTPGQGTPVATVGGRVLTTGQLGAELAALNPYRRAYYSDPAHLAEYAEKAAEFQLLALEACRRELWRKPDVAYALDRALVQALVEQEGAGALAIAEPTQAELEAYYQQHLSEYQRPEQRSFAQILLRKDASQAAAPEAAALAQRLLVEARAKPGERNAFKLLAMQHSQEPGAQVSGGEHGYFDQQSLALAHGPEVAAAVFGLARINDLPERVVESADGLHVVKLTGLKRAINRPLAQVRVEVNDAVTQAKRQERTQSLLAGLKERYGYRFDERAARQIPLDATPRLPQGAPSP